MSEQRVAVVTGSNKGIGYAVVKALCKKFNGVVYLTARDEQKGLEAVKKLKKNGLNPQFYQLDVSDQTSVDNFRDHLKATHSKLDVLINNAGVRILEPDPTGAYAEKTIDINYFGLLYVCEALFPLLNTKAKVINVSSSAGHLFRIPGSTKREKFSSRSLTISELNKLMKAFLEDFKNNNLEKKGWPKSAYTVSKVAVSALSIIQQKLFDEEIPNRNISVNFIHPGWVSTDLNQKGSITPDESATTFVWLITETNVKGKYVWFDRQIIDWYAPNTPPRPYPLEYRRK